MANPTIQFTKTDDYILVPGDRLQLSLRALPPAGASLAITVYAAPLGQDSGFRQIGQRGIDNLANEAATSEYRLGLTPGIGYVFRLTGDARLLVPGVHAMTVGLVLGDASGAPIHDFGNQYVEAAHALLDGHFFVRMR